MSSGMAERSPSPLPELAPERRQSQEMVQSVFGGYTLGSGFERISPVRPPPIIVQIEVINSTAPKWTTIVRFAPGSSYTMLFEDLERRLREYLERYNYIEKSRGRVEITKIEMGERDPNNVRVPVDESTCKDALEILGMRQGKEMLYITAKGKGFNEGQSMLDKQLQDAHPKDEGSSKRSGGGFSKLVKTLSPGK